MKRKLLGLLFIFLLTMATASAQFGGIVYDPTNYQNAVLRYEQLQLQLEQLEKSYAQITNQLNLAKQMAQFLRNMPARYRALFSAWRNVSAADLFGNTSPWVSGIN